MATSKQQTILKLSHCVLQLEATRGHLKWKVSDVVRKAGVDRALAYRYFGNSKKAILLNATRFFIEDYYDFTNVNPKTTFGERVARARKRLQAYPEAIMLYQRNRSTETFLSAEYVAAEKKFHGRLKALYPHLNDDQIELAHTCIHGIVTAPFISVERAQELGQKFEKQFLKP
ncbi:MAG: TetR/AcrR family transcriptional regulator [Bdellovibrionota bacterium]